MCDIGQLYSCRFTVLGILWRQVLSIRCSLRINGREGGSSPSANATNRISGREGGSPPSAKTNKRIFRKEVARPLPQKQTRGSSVGKVARPLPQKQTSGSSVGKRLDPFRNIANRNGTSRRSGHRARRVCAACSVSFCGVQPDLRACIFETNLVTNLPIRL